MVDYVSKWVEVIVSPINDTRVFNKFFKRVIFPRFGITRVLISDAGTYFIERKFKAMITKYGLYHKKGVK